MCNLTKFSNESVLNISLIASLLSYLCPYFCVNTNIQSSELFLSFTRVNPIMA